MKQFLVEKSKKGQFMFNNPENKFYSIYFFVCQFSIKKKWKLNNNNKDFKRIEIETVPNKSALNFEHFEFCSFPNLSAFNF